MPETGPPEGALHIINALRGRGHRALLAGGCVRDRAMAAAFRHLKLVVEPGGAIALAAALGGAFDCRGKTVAVVCSGGNVDPETFAAAIHG